MVGPELDRLAQMKKDGVMTVQLTYNNRNLAGDGALEPANAGLQARQGDDRADRGGETVARPVPWRGADDGRGGGFRQAALGDQPHRGRALTDHPRNTDDATIRAVADKGGVVGVYFMPFLTARRPPEGADLIAHSSMSRSRGRGPCRDRHRQWCFRSVMDEEAKKRNPAVAGGAYQAGDRVAGRGAGVFR